MNPLQVQFAVPYRFAVHFTRHAFAPDQDLLAEVLLEDGGTGRALVYVDERVASAHPQLMNQIHTWFSLHEVQGVRLAATPEAIPGGEAGKASLAIVERIAKTCHEVGLCRHSAVVIIGGGAVLDAVGFAASLVHRGIRQIRLPTTTLAQADAGLGVKNAINAFSAKNFLGTFTPPRAIINDAAFLPALDARSWRAGIAEAVKVAIIRDAPFLGELAALAPALARREDSAIARVIRRSAELHLEHIAGAGDPFEQGSSRPLDFGHWSAHRLEVLTQHRLQHGEAVAIGVAADLLYAAAIGRISDAEAESVLTTLAICGFRLWDEALDLRDANGRRLIYQGLAQFREHLGGILTLAMPDGLGRQRDLLTYDEALGDQAWMRLRRWKPSISLPSETPIR